MGDGYSKPVDTFEDAMSKFKGVNPDGVGVVDLHAWVELEDGTILDYDNNNVDYASVRSTNGLTEKQHYHKLSKHVNKQVYRELVKKVIMPYMRDIKKNNSRIDFKDTKELWRYCEQLEIACPSGHCFFRAYVYQKKFGGKIQIGSMGWENPKGEIWWEFG